ncbi:MAG: hypothetical protein LC808_19980, partial [Actinobacteria bacterium]|nr:hypothetical protein [Actinomycetota bacterium]
VYIGPLGSNAGAITNGDLRPIVGLRNTLVGAATYLRDANNVEATWSAYSKLAPLDTGAVIGGWIDDAFDTQRRRGLDPTKKDPWGTFLG